MLVIYSKETTSFSNLGLGILKDFTTPPLINEELNGAYTLEFSYAKDGQLSEYLVEQNLIKANGQAFRIWNVKKDLTTIKILAKHLFFDLNFNYLVNVAPTNLNAQNGLNWLLNHAEQSTLFTVNGDCILQASARYVRKNVTDAIFNDDNAFVKRFGCELSYNNYAIYCHQRRGQNANFSIMYKKNLTGLDFNLDFSTTATRIIPLGFDGLMIDNVYVESPIINNYFTPLYKTYEFSDVKYDPDDENAFHDIEDAKQELENRAIALFNEGADKPKISIKVDFVELAKCSEYSEYSNLEQVHLGDTIKAILPQLNIELEARVVKTTYDCLLNRITKLEIGSVTPSSVKTQINLQQEVKSRASIINDAQANAEDLINHPFKGNVYIDRDSGTIYLMDTDNINTAQSIWKWSLGGLGYSATGVNGQYSTAITQDGSIVADFITTGKISTSVIEGMDSIVLRINQAIDENGNAIAVKTTNGFTFDVNGLDIYTDENSYNTQINNIGTYYKDGETIISQTTKDGTITKDIVLYGRYYYGVDEDLAVENFTKNDSMFVAMKFTDGNGEECFGHFYNGD